ncbi:hypothetical protein chiPu_0025137, partial [Chiloscyllium punctatum]|nr:hypothetical protein [Chiloscyllium punctatum]
MPVRVCSPDQASAGVSPRPGQCGSESQTRPIWECAPDQASAEVSPDQARAGVSCGDKPVRA